jgi:predicted house-cleaning noncanonical NTP pyrophosphatase (MazG superfamily)
MKKLHNKLVRNKIPLIIESHGETMEVRKITDDKEYLIELCRKLIEEAQEVADDPSLEELADTLEVVYSVGAVLGYTPRAIEAARLRKQQERGGFDDRIYLISTSK